MKQFFILIILLQLSSSISSQEIKTNTFLTKKQNIEWIEKFEQLTSESNQIASIKNKILKDSLFHISNVSIHNWGFKKIERKSFGSGKNIYKSNCECKIMFKLIVKSDEYLLDYSEYEYTQKILDLINESNVDKITIYKNDMAGILFGERGKCGVIILYSNKRKLKKKIKKSLKSINSLN